MKRDPSPIVSFFSLSFICVRVCACVCVCVCVCVRVCVRVCRRTLRSARCLILRGSPLPLPREPPKSSLESELRRSARSCPRSSTASEGLLPMPCPMTPAADALPRRPVPPMLVGGGERREREGEGERERLGFFFFFKSDSFSSHTHTDTDTDTQTSFLSLSSSLSLSLSLPLTVLCSL